MRETVFLLTKQECDNDIGQQQQQQQVGMFYYTPSQPYSKILLHCWSTNRTSSQELTVTLQGEPMRGKWSTIWLWLTVRHGIDGP